MSDLPHEQDTRLNNIEESLSKLLEYAADTARTLATMDGTLPQRDNLDTLTQAVAETIHSIGRDLHDAVDALPVPTEFHPEHIAAAIHTSSCEEDSMSD